VTIVRVIAVAAILLRPPIASAQGRITGAVYDSLSTHAPLANATVVLVETSRYATTDARGRFGFDSVPDGHYTLGFTSSVLDSLGVELPVVPVDIVGRSRRTVKLSTPSMTTMLVQLCPGPRESDAGVLIGRIRDVDDHTMLPDATIGTDWTEFTLTGLRTVGHRVRVAAQANTNGVYRLCGVPTKVPLELHAQRAGFMAGPVPLLMDEPQIRRVDFAISKRDSAARITTHPDASNDSTTAHGTASLRGTVFGADRRPIRNAVLDVFGTLDTTRTNAAGAFRLANIAAGTRAIEVRSIGLLPVTVAMDFAANGVRDTTLSMIRRAPVLAADTVKGKAQSIPSMDDGFETRRMHGLGAYVTADEISRHTFSNLPDILRGVGSVSVECDATKGSAMGCLPVPYLRGSCVPNVFLDGVEFAVTKLGSVNGTQRVADPRRFEELSEIARPELIRGIEVYAGPGTVPAQYDRFSSTACGSVVIWTKY
jgi:hypothetical protein